MLTLKSFNAFFLPILLTVVTFSSFAQVPQAFKYQAVIRDSTGILLSNQPVSIKTTILSGSENGQEAYAETHTDTTNQFGLVNIEIGSGTALIGAFDTIPWESGAMFLKIAIDHTGGSNYVHISTTQLQSVPYSMYAHKAGLLTNAAGTNFIETDRIPGIDKIRFNVADTQRWVMEKARLQPSNSGRSIFIGRLAGENDDFSENRNVFIGDNSNNLVGI